MTTDKNRLTWTVTEWPIADQALWSAATQPVSPFGKKNPAISWSVARRHIVEDGYGQWLAWLSTKGGLDPALRPGLRVTPERVRCYVDNIECTACAGERGDDGRFVGANDGSPRADPRLGLVARRVPTPQDDRPSKPRQAEGSGPCEGPL